MTRHYWTEGEVERYADDYSRHNSFVSDCIDLVSVIDASPELLALIVAEYGDECLADAISAPDWMIGRPWQSSGLRHAVVVRLDDYRTSTTTEGPPAA